MQEMARKKVGIRSIFLEYRYIHKYIFRFVKYLSVHNIRLMSNNERSHLFI